MTYPIQSAYDPVPTAFNTPKPDYATLDDSFDVVSEDAIIPVKREEDKPYLGSAEYLG